MSNIPMSRIKGSFQVGENVLNGKIDRSRDEVGLVDDLNIYENDLDLTTLAPTIRDFYERTTAYRLFARVKWRLWFKPFAAIYRLLSLRTKQINLPLSPKEVEMTGDIVPVQEKLDGRPSPRAWLRKVGEDVCFVAIYSFHQHGNRTYMNIGLPLPWSTMSGILELNQQGDELTLSSKRIKSQHADSGTYLAIGKKRWKLPIEEYFHVKEVEPGVLTATHGMWIFSLPFLRIDYRIYEK